MPCPALTCCVHTPYQFTGLSGYLARNAVLASTDSTCTCCQGQLYQSCVPECRGNQCGNWLEACLCPTLSISISRCLLMQHRQLHPDPTDYQLIRCSNVLHCVSCVCDITACCISMFIGGEAA